MDDINKHLNSAISLASLVSPDNFVNLNSELQSQIIDSVSKNDPSKGGIMGKLLGTDSKNVAMNIVFLVCVLLIVVIILDVLHSHITSQSVNMELINCLIPVVSLSLGFLFGKGSE